MISASGGRKLWRYMLLKAFAPSYERMEQLFETLGCCKRHYLYSARNCYAVLAPGL